MMTDWKRMGLEVLLGCVQRSRRADGKWQIWH